MKEEFYTKKVDDVINLLDTDISRGLKNSEVSKRLVKYGKNVLPEKPKDSIIKIFFKGLTDPIVILLCVTVIISFFIGEYIDAFAIIFIILLDLILGTIEEYHANKNADSLKKLIKYDVKVIRDSAEESVDSSLIVPGDIVLLESGDNIAADMRILECSNFQVNESILTGESVGVFKTNQELSPDTPLVERKNILYAGCNVITGRAIATVVQTGIKTEIGNIAETVSKIKEEKSPLAIRMEKLSKQISILILCVALIIFLVLYLKGFTFSEIFMSVIALTVSAMPEGLPLALTMALTITSNYMVKKKVIVKKLNYVESLGSCTVIATDKTGTLTVNEQTAKVIILPNEKKYNVQGVGYRDNGYIEKLDTENRSLVEKIILHGKINNEALYNKKKYLGDSIDIAFLVLAKKANIYSDEFEILKRIPYESENKYSAVYYKYRGKIYCTVKGSYEVVASFCDRMNLDNKEVSIEKKVLSKQNEALSKNGYRVIAIASGKVEEFNDKDFYNQKDIPKLSFEGMVGFIDPIRKEVSGAIEECREAGIKVLMITGDHPLTAFSIAKDLGLATDYNEVTTGVELDSYIKKGNHELDEFIKQKRVFARVTPMNKLKIVESLKRQGEFVAVTGDGVNDAPAIRSANIGVSMGSGTDTAKETASMIIVDDNFKSIVSGIELGRVAYSNIRKVCFFLLSCGLAEVLFYLLSIIFDLPMPLVAIQLLWLNLVTDGFQDIALSCEKSEKGIMKRKPIDPKESIFNGILLDEVVFSGFLIGIIVFVFWYFLIKDIGMEVTMARGYIMVLMVFIQNIHVFNCRSETESVFTISLRSNPLIVFTTFGSIILQIIVMEIPALSNFLKATTISYSHIFILISISLLILVAMEIYKLVRFHLGKKEL